MAWLLAHLALGVTSALAVVASGALLRAREGRRAIADAVGTRRQLAEGAARLAAPPL